MKKLILLILLSVLVIGCTDRNPDGSTVLYQERKLDYRNPYIEIIDSCEYIIWGYRMAHKGNCKFCTQRREQELKEIVEQINN